MFSKNIGSIFEFLAYLKVTSRLSKMGDTKVTSGMSKMKGGRGGGSRPLLDNVQKKDAF